MNNTLKVFLPGGPALQAGDVEVENRLLTISPPSPSMFDQLLVWLETRSLRTSVELDPQMMGVGATALCLRWGTYLAILLDESRLEAGNERFSQVAEEEMMRINIEFSSNLARLLKWLHEDEEKCFRLLEAAWSKLPMPERHAGLSQDFLEPYIQLLSPLFWSAAKEEIRSRLDRALPTVREHPYRVLANSLALHSYRNGPIEKIHAGREGRFSLDHRRVTEAESRAILQFTSRHLAPVIASFRPWEDEPDHPVAWPDKLAGIYISPFLTSRSWTLTEESSSVRLPLGSQT